MPAKIVAFSLLMLSLSSFAQIGEQLLYQIETLNDPQFGISKVKDPCQTCEAEKSKSALFDSCVQKICADRGLANFLMIPGSSQISSSDLEAAEKEIARIQKEAQSLAIGLDDPRRVRALEAVRQGRFEIPSESLSFAFQMMGGFLIQNGLKANATGDRFVIDEEKWKEKADRLPISDQNKAVLRQFAERYHQVSAFQLDDNELSKLTLDEYFLQHYPQLTREHAVRRIAMEYRHNFESMKKSSAGQFMGHFSNLDSAFAREIVEDIESGKDVPELAVKELISRRTSNFNTMLIFYPPRYADLIGQIDKDDFKKFLMSDQIQAAWKRTFDEYTKKRPVILQENTEACIAVYRRNMRILPSEEQLQDLKNEVVLVKDKIKNDWAKRYSKQTSGEIEKYLEKVDFFYPPTRESYKRAFFERLNREKIENERIQKDILSDDSKTGFAMAALIGAMEIRQKPNSRIDLPCQGDRFSPMNDANYTSHGKIQLSYTLAHSPLMARGVIAHELGHGISKLLQSPAVSGHSRQKYQAEMRCLASLHKKNGSQFSEEDYADWTAAHITKSNLACLFPQALLKNTKAVEVTNPSQDHSSPFFRLLHIETLQHQKLPVTCNKLLVEQKTPQDFELCARQAPAQRSQRKK